MCRKLLKSKSLWTLITLVYAGAVVVEKRVKNMLPKPQAKVEQRWGKIEHLRRVVERLESELDCRRRGIHPTPRQWRNQKVLTKIFGDLRSISKLRATLEHQKSLWKKSHQLKRVKTGLRKKRLNSQYKTLGP